MSTKIIATFTLQTQARKRESYKSMWTKSRERGAARKYLSGNFKAGHVTPNEHYLSRAGLRGRKRYLFLGIFILLYIITVAHLLVSENHCTLSELHSAMTCKISVLSATPIFLLWIYTNCLNCVTRAQNINMEGFSMEGFGVLNWLRNAVNNLASSHVIL